MCAMLCEEVFEIFYTLADRRYLNRLMDRENISAHQASAEARTHAAALAGRPISPLLFALGPFYPFLADAISFIASITSLLLVKPVAESRETSWPTVKQVTREIGEGVGQVKGDRRIWLTSSLMALTNVVSQALILIFIVEAHSRELSTLDIGIVLGASGVGGALGSFSSEVVLRFVRKRWLPIQMGSWLIVLLILALAHGDITLWSAVAMFFMSVTGAIGNVESQTYLTENIADDMIGKISGITRTMTIAACAAGLGFRRLRHPGVFRRPVFGLHTMRNRRMHDSRLAPRIYRIPAQCSRRATAARGSCAGRLPRGRRRDRGWLRFPGCRRTE